MTSLVCLLPEEFRKLHSCNTYLQYIPAIHTPIAIYSFRKNLPFCAPMCRLISMSERRYRDTGEPEICVSGKQVFHPKVLLVTNSSPRSSFAFGRFRKSLEGRLRHECGVLAVYP